MDDVLDKMAAQAAAGEPDDMNWTCGQCGRDGADGVRSYPYRVDRPDGNLDFQARLICPCCSFARCEHRQAAAAACR